MATKKPEELKELNDEELVQKLQGLKRQMFDLRMQRADGKLTQPHLLRRARRDVAHALTLLKQRSGAATTGGKK